MADLIQSLDSLFVKKESVEGTEVLGTITDAILCENVVTPTVREFNERKNYVQAMGTRNAKIGAQMGTAVDFATEIKGSGIDTICEVDQLLECVFGLKTTDTFASTGMSGAQTSTSLAYSGGSGNYTQGNALLVENTVKGAGIYEMCWVTSASGSGATGTITVAPALTFTPSNTAKIAATTTYQVQDTGHSSLSIQNYLSATQAIKAVGCRGNVKFTSPKAGSIPMLAWAFKGWNWVHSTVETRPAGNPTFDTAAAPVVATGSIFKLAGVKQDVLSADWDLGNVITPKMSQNSTLGCYGMPVTDRNVTGAIKIHSVAGTITNFTNWLANTQLSISHQFNAGVANKWQTVGWYMPFAERKTVALGNDGGVITEDISFNGNISVGQDSLYISFG